MNEVSSQSPPVEAPGSELRHAAQQLITGEVEQEVGGRPPPKGREIDLQANAGALAPDRDDDDGHHDDDGGGEPQRPASRPSRSPGACGSNGRSERRRAGRIFPAERLEGLLHVVIVALDHSRSSSSSVLSAAFPRS